MPENIRLVGPPEKTMPDNIATPYRLPLSERPSIRWSQHFQRIEWRKFNVPHTPVLDDDKIGVPWIDDQKTMFAMLDGIKEAIAAINPLVGEEVAEEERTKAEEARKTKEVDQGRQATLERWWYQQQEYRRDG